jgi:hypothetical protein
MKKPDKISNIPETEKKKLIDIDHYHLENSTNSAGTEKWKNLLDFLYHLKSNNIRFISSSKKQ